MTYYTDKHNGLWEYDEYNWKLVAGNSIHANILNLRIDNIPMYIGNEEVMEFAPLRSIRTNEEYEFKYIFSPGEKIMVHSNALRISLTANAADPTIELVVVSNVNDSYVLCQHPPITVSRQFLENSRRSYLNA